MNELKTIKHILSEHSGNFFSNPSEFTPAVDITAAPYNVSRTVAAKASRFSCPVSFLKVNERVFFEALGAGLVYYAPRFAELTAMDGHDAPQLFGDVTTHGADVVTDEATIDTHETAAVDDVHEVDFSTSGDTVEPTRTDKIGKRTTTDSTGERERTTQYGDVTTHKETTPTYTAYKSHEFADNERFRLLALAITAAMGECGVAF